MIDRAEETAEMKSGGPGASAVEPCFCCRRWINGAARDATFRNGVRAGFQENHLGCLDHQTAPGIVEALSKAATFFVCSRPGLVKLSALLDRFIDPVGQQEGGWLGTNFKGESATGPFQK
ncbi:hypothetical protein L1887_53528 [Cichorium endivia]|nr:hypothetical protein L1887_53528 [Cichorium endivia]